ncbi:MAG TPA: GntR family transcriptional regulator [Gaiellaceae bacterium]|nr:GntR family transcriptional regulator [Gaiellaceae bacterium]
MSTARQEQPPFLTKSEYAYAEVRQRILDGRLPPGTRLLLRPLAHELGVSVMPVRDAIRLLERDGLVTVENHRGATVTKVEREGVVESVGIRMWLEVLAVREATPRHTARTLAAAERALAEAARAAKARKPLAYARANRDVHNALEAPAPASLRGLVEEMWDRLWQARRSLSLFVLDPRQIAAAERDHLAIYGAVARGDADGAAAAMEAHRERTLAAWHAAPEQPSARS